MNGGRRRLNGNSDGLGREKASEREREEEPPFFAHLPARKRGSRSPRRVARRPGGALLFSLLSRLSLSLSSSGSLLPPIAQWDRASTSFAALANNNSATNSPPLSAVRARHQGIERRVGAHFQLVRARARASSSPLAPSEQSKPSKAESGGPKCAR